MSSSWTDRALALGAAAPASRGGRWLARQSGQDVASLETLAAVPPWLGWPASQRRRMAMAAALLHYRAQMDAELRSEVLGPLAALVGEPLFDAVCDAQTIGKGEGTTIPAPIRLGSIGEDLVARAWAAPGGAATPDPYAKDLAAAAAELIARQKP